MTYVNPLPTYRITCDLMLDRWNGDVYETIYVSPTVLMRSADHLAGQAFTSEEVSLLAFNITHRDRPAIALGIQGVVETLNSLPGLLPFP